MGLFEVHSYRLAQECPQPTLWALRARRAFQECSFCLVISQPSRERTPQLAFAGSMPFHLPSLAARITRRVGQRCCCVFRDPREVRKLPCHCAFLSFQNPPGMSHRLSAFWLCGVSRYKGATPERQREGDMTRTLIFSSILRSQLSSEKPTTKHRHSSLPLEARPPP